MSFLEALTHEEEIKQLLNRAQAKYDLAKKTLERQKIITTRRLKRLGKVKISAWSNEMDDFAKAFGVFKDIEINRNLDNNLKFVGYDVEPKEMLISIENASLTANEIVKAGFAAVGTGAIVGIAAYGGAMMFGKASTGTAISTLSGAAKKNATLAWFGGGSKASGGLGMEDGKMVLAGVAVLPIVAVAALITGVKGREKLAEAKKIYAEAENAAMQMHTITVGMQGIAAMADNYASFIKKSGRKFRQFIKELNHIRGRYPLEEDGYISFDRLSLVGQKTLHLSWLIAQIHYNLLSTPILDAEGEVSGKSEETLSISERDIRQIKKDTFHMSGEEALVGNIVWRPKANMMLVVGFIAAAALVALGIMSVRNSMLKGILLIICALVAFPIFFVFRVLPSSKLFIWRLVRVIAAILLAIVISILL